MRIRRNFLTAALAGATVLAANLLLTETAFAGNALQKCSNWRATGKGPAPNYTPNSVTAECGGKKVELWLPGVVGVSNGQLRWARNGHFDRHVKDCSMKGSAVMSVNAPPSRLAFGCMTKKGNGWASSTLNLGDLTYSNGKLNAPV